MKTRSMFRPVYAVVTTYAYVAAPAVDDKKTKSPTLRIHRGVGVSFKVI